MTRRPPVSPLPGDFPTVSAVELRRNFGLWMSRVATAPIAVERHRRARMVLSSPEHYLQMVDRAEAVEDGLASAIAAIPEHSSEAFVALDRDLRILAVNRIFEDMVGRNGARIVGLPVADLFPHDAEPLLIGHLRHVLASGAMIHFEAPSVLLEGRYYAFTLFPHATGVAALIVNITAERALSREIEVLRSLAAAVAAAPGVGHFQINLRGLVCAASPQLQALTGRSPANGGLGLTDLATLDERARLSEVLERVLSAASPARIATTFADPRGTPIPVALSLSPIWQGPDVSGAAGFFAASV